MFKLYKYLFLALLAALGFSYYKTLHNFQTVTAVSPAVRKPPSQTKAKVLLPVTLAKGDSEFVLEPLFDYEVSALVMGTSRNYISRIRKVVPFDVGLVWGETALSGEFRKVRCWVMVNHLYAKWPAGAKVDMKDMSNHHIVPGSPEVLAMLHKLVPGDQVRLRGRLVNVRSYPRGKAGQGRPDFEMLSSTGRNDQGDGACEILYIESPDDISVLQVADRTYPEMFRYCLWAIPALILAFFVHSHVPFLMK